MGGSESVYRIIVSEVVYLEQGMLCIIRIHRE